jgi:hypothetical protein
MADIYFNGQRTNNVTHIGYDPGSKEGDHTAITVRQHDGQMVVIDEAERLQPKDWRKLNRMIERGKYIGKPGIIGRLRYRWYKLRGRTPGGTMYYRPMTEGDSVIKRMLVEKK